MKVYLLPEEINVSIKKCVEYVWAKTAFPVGSLCVRSNLFFFIASNPSITVKKFQELLEIFYIKINKI